MNTVAPKTFATLALVACLPLLGACGGQSQAPTQSGGSDASASTGHAPQTAIGRTVQKAMNEAKAKLATENISIADIKTSGDGVSISTSDGKDGRPKAEITPQGDLLIDGRKVPANAQQQALLLQYRKQVETIAGIGMDLGVQGADLGMRAAGDAIASIFRGDGDQVEKRIEAEADKIEASAMKLCDQLPGMLQTQDQLAAVMPEFKPYARMEQSDIDDCRDGKGSRDGVQVRQEVRDEIRTGIRKSIQTAVQATGVDSDQGNTNAAAEAEAASAGASTH